MRPALLVLVLFTIGCGRPDPAPDARTTLARAAEWLWAQQAEDGGWHSETHGIVRGGQAWTAFALDALLQVPDSVAAPPEGGVERALAFLRARVNEDGALGYADTLVFEYPVYATAYALRVFARHDAPGDSALVRRMAAWLAAQQYDEDRGIAPEHLAYGAWGFGETGLPSGQVGHLDLSHTRRALEGLRAASHDDAGMWTAATRFLRFVQKHPSDTRPQPPGNVPADSSLYDGGFYASPTAVGTNKAGALTGPDGQPRAFRSYATTTADGLLALLAAGHALDSEPVQAAAAWLRAHPGWSEPSGIPPDDPAQWHRVMELYHAASRAEAYAALGEPGRWRDDLVRELAARQRDDGSFVNPDGAPNKEDDPILATALAITALTAASR
ncbi:MAG TPA: prenyltransferase/squalene oxidase repeat-containing protein [Rubricoccaceae bacterium]|nr:prenyltransferase/squalene oxidase repeat-containing protein [Rubricoccaceae bacterium]